MKLASLILCLLCCTGLKSIAQTTNPKQTEEYTNLVKIVEAYQQNQPAKVANLQTKYGKRLCDRFYAQPWFFTLPTPELLGFEDKSHRAWPGVIMVYEHHLKFVFKNTKNPALEGQIISATFFKEHNIWRFHDIIYDENKYASALTPEELVDRLKINPNAIDLIKAAHVVMVTPPNEFANLKTAITEVQEMAEFNGFGQNKAVQDFISAANDLEAFATKWNQTIEAVSSDKFSAQLNAMIDAKVHAAYNGIPSGSAEAEAKMGAEIKKEIESTFRQTLNALNPKDAEEYGQRMDKLSKAYKPILHLIHN
jgi:hypothetical protein